MPPRQSTTAGKSKRKLPENVEAVLKDIFRDCELEDDHTRTLQIKAWKKYEEYWHGIQFLFWSEVLQDWATPQQGIQVGIVGEETREAVGPFYDYVINVFKAHGESMISAMSQSIPNIEFFPDDADDPADLSAANAKSKLAVIFQKHVSAKLRIIEALFKLYNQGIAASYRYRDADEKYGTHKIRNYSQQTVDVTHSTCPQCGRQLDEIADQLPSSEIPTCPDCQMQGVPTTTSEEQTVLSGITEVPKEHECFEIYGPLNVKVPYYARNQKDCGYLIWYIEKHFAEVRDLFPDFYEDIKPDAGKNRERWARTPSSYSTAWRGGSEDRNLCTIKRVWFRPWMTNFLSKDTNKNEISYLKEHFKQGTYFTIVGEKIVDYDDESMDKCWRICQSGPSTYIHSDPLGAGLAPIQEMKNQLANMTIQTIEYGIPALFADRRILNFDEFGNQESSPGMITPVRKPAEFNSIGDGFYEQKIATPSKEIEVFAARLDEDAQFVTGDYPSIYGGPSEGKSRTLGEYVQSSKRALARLALCYEYVRNWWAEAVGISVDAMVEDILKYGEPERAVVKEKGEFDNIIVNPEDLAGHTGGLSPEASENFPLSSDQKMGLILQLIQLQNPMVEAVVAHPENTHIVTEALGMPDLYIPGEAQRFKALSTIRELLKSPPVELGAEVLPVTEPDPDVDDPMTQIAIFKYYLSSERGMQTRKKNPAGYAHVKAYLKLLNIMLQQQTINQMGASPPMAPPVEEKTHGA